MRHIILYTLLRIGSGGFGIGAVPTGIDGNELDAVKIFFCMEGLITLILGDGSYNNQNKNIHNMMYSIHLVCVYGCSGGNYTLPSLATW